MNASAGDLHTNALENLDAVMWEADPVTFQFTYVSRGAERFLGYALDHWLTRPAFWVDLLHPDDRERAVNECQAAVQEGRDHDFEYRVRAADGRVLWIRDLVRVICNESGQATGLRGVMLDITERNLTESALHRKDRYYRALIEQALDIIAVVGHDGTIRYESPSAERILGYPRHQRLGRGIFDLVHTDDVDRLRAVFEGSMVTGRPTTLIQFRYRHANGSWRTLEAIGRRFMDEDGEPAAIINCRDITERQRLEEQFRDAQKMEALGRLTSTIAHDFSNILTVVLGSVELALESEHSVGLGYELGEIKHSAELGAALTQQLLAFSRRTDADASEVVDIDARLAELEGFLQRLLGSSVQIELALDAPAARVRLGKGMLEQIVMNLAVNARDAMPGGGKLLVSTMTWPATTAVVIGDTVQRVTIQVADTGSGIRPEIRCRLFEPYFTTKEPGKGTGLGLSTIYRIVRDSGGYIDVESEPGQGTRFRIHLPVVT